MLKKILYLAISPSDYSAVEELQVYHFSINSIDIVMGVTTHVFTSNDSNASKGNGNYRIPSLLENAEEEKERQIALALSWETDVIHKILLDPDLGSSLFLSWVDLGLWFSHKGRHHLSGVIGVDHILHLIQDSGGILNRTIRNTRNLNNRSLRVKLLLRIRNAVPQITTLLRELLEEVSRHEASMDILTKLLNRRFLPTIFKREIARVNQTGTPLSVLTTGADKFKEADDTWDRSTGDEILRRVPQAPYDNVYNSDYALRYGDDEFIIVLTEASENKTLRTVECIHSRVEKTKLKAANGEDIAPLLSVSVVMFNGHPDHERLIQIADEALYIARRRGRSRVELWKASLQMRQDAEVIMKLTGANNAADGIFFPALEQNIMDTVLTNENDKVIFFNPAAEKFWGYKREEVIGNNIDMLIPRNLCPAYPEYIRHNREGGKARVKGISRELQPEKKDGSKIQTCFTLLKVSAEGKVYYLALIWDTNVEMARKEQTRQLIIAVGHFDRPMIALDPERHIMQCNRVPAEILGYCISEASGMQSDTLLNIPEFPVDNRIRLQQLLWKTACDQDELLLLTRTGEEIWIKASISPTYDVLACLQNLVMIFSNVTEEQQIHRLEGDTLAAMCNSPPFYEMEEIICRNIESTFNKSYVSLFTLRNGMPIHWASLSHGAEIQDTQNWSVTIRQHNDAPAGILQTKASSETETSAPIERAADISQHTVALVLEQEKNHQHTEQLIQSDPMVGLPNCNNLHNYFGDLVDKAVPPVAYFIGADHIQDVIDSPGYMWADQVLLGVVNRFYERLRPDQYLCRIEGTQFVSVSLENDVSNITQTADKLRNVVSKPTMTSDKPLPLTSSIGISYSLDKNRSYPLSTVHNAMDYVRKNGGNGWQLFSPTMNETVKGRLVLGAALKEAISNNQLKLVYQPQIFAETGGPYDIEALARWHDPLHGHVPPLWFIPLAEEIGGIENIGRWVIVGACCQLAEQCNQNIHIPALPVSLSALHFHSNQLPNQVSDAICAWGIDGHQLTVEITESTTMEHGIETFKRIQIPCSMGAGSSIDDFDTGLSGLSHLASLLVTETKVDKSLVDRCPTEKRTLALLEVITSIGQSLNLTIVAEGVETKEQFEMLHKIHCRITQGHFFPHPLPAEEISGRMSSALPSKI